MLIDARTLPQDSVLRADVCVIGGGAAGIVAALELRDSGLSVALVESGGPDGEDPLTRSLNEGTSEGRPLRNLIDPVPLDVVRLRWLGGTTNHWAGYCRRLEPVDFERRDDLPVSGWPITYNQMEPYWERAARWCAISNSDDDAGRWSERVSVPAPMRADEAVHTRAFQVVGVMAFGDTYRSQLETAEDISVVLWANVVNLATDDGRNVRAAVVRTLGGVRAEVRARAFVLAAGGLENPRLMLASTDASPNGLGNATDQVGRYFAEHLQVAGGFALLEPEVDDLAGYTGVDTTINDGLNAGRSHGVKFALALTSQHVRDAGTLGLEAQILVDSLPVGVPAQRSGLTAADISALRGLLTAHKPGATPRPASDEQAAGWGSEQVEASSGDATQNPASQGPAAQSLTVQQPASQSPTTVAYLQCMAEQRLYPQSRVTLGAERDALGMRRIRLHWHYGEHDRAAVIGGLRTMAEWLGSNGLGRLQVIPAGITLGAPHFFDPQRFINLYGVDVSRTNDEDFTIGVGYHHMCTTRMSDDPADGVVDANCKVHAMDNLWVAGSSVFGTGGTATPTLTIVALACRLANHLREVLA